MFVGKPRGEILPRLRISPNWFTLKRANFRRIEIKKFQSEIPRSGTGERIKIEWNEIATTLKGWDPK